MEHFRLPITGWGAGLLLLSLLFASCDDDDKEAVPQASISISQVKGTRTTLSFTLTPENAVSYEYACVKTTEPAPQEMIRVHSSATGSFTVPDLDPGTAYRIMARATNADGITCEPVAADGATNALPSLAFGEFTTDSHSASVTVTTTGAPRFYWYCIEQGSPVPDEPAWTEVVCENPETPLTIAADAGGNPLKSATVYDIRAYPADAEGPGETVTAGFTTPEARPVTLKITRVGTDDIELSVTMDQTLCDMYLVAASSPLIIDMIDWEEELMWNARWVESRSFSLVNDELTTVRPGETYKIAVAPFRKNGYSWILIEDKVVTEEVTSAAE